MIACRMRRILCSLLWIVTAVKALHAPVINLHPQVVVVQGSEVRLECLAQGDPSPTVRFYRNGALVQGQEPGVFPPNLPNVGGAKYMFTAVQGSGGPYECRASNGIADANGNTVIKKVINVIITGLSTTTPQTPSTTMKNTGLSTTPQTPSTTMKNTGPTNPVLTEEPVKPTDEDKDVVGDSSTTTGSCTRFLLVQVILVLLFQIW